MAIKKELNQRRKNIEKLKVQCLQAVTDHDSTEDTIQYSWQRSSQAKISSEMQSAPLAKVSENISSLDHALKSCETALRDIAHQSSMVLAVADQATQIRWVQASRHMQGASESVHFVQGGQWREDLVGTNALALSLYTGKSSCVFSNEHYLHAIQDWVCYAAPIYHPSTGQVLGVVDLSTTWDQHNSLGVLAAERCAQMIQGALREQTKQHLQLSCLGSTKAQLQGKALNLSPRQFEIIAILSLCKQGMSLDQLHQALYGERKVSMGTLKAEMSQLRDLLGGMLGSRPYRLLLDVDADFIELEEALDQGASHSALQLYQGIFLPRTESPFLTAWRDCIESRMSEVIFKIDDKDLLLKHLSHFPDAIDAVERLMELLPEDHPMQQSLRRMQDQ